MKVKMILLNDAERISEFYRENSDHLHLWEPLREKDHHVVSAWRERLKKQEVDQSEGREVHFISINPQNNEVIATCSLTNIIRGPFQACNIGYAISKQYQGKGDMKKLCRHVIHYAFNELGLNRIMANYMPKNHRSEVLLNGLGFSKEGTAKKYLRINGKWEDHVLTSLLNPKHT